MLGFNKILTLLKTLERNINYYRRKNKLSQQALSDLLKTSKNSISNWENGVSLPPLEKLIHMSKIFGLTLDEFVIIPYDMRSENDIEARKYYTSIEVQEYNLTEVVQQLVDRIENIEHKFHKKKKNKKQK